jgi:hypothetical protein
VLLNKLSRRVSVLRLILISFHQGEVIAIDFHIALFVAEKILVAISGAVDGGEILKVKSGISQLLAANGSFSFGIEIFQYAAVLAQDMVDALDGVVGIIVDPVVEAVSTTVRAELFV